MGFHYSPARLKQARLNAGYGLERFAAAAGVTVAMLLKWERGDTEPAIKSITKLARTLNVSIEAFFTDEPEPRPTPKPAPKRIGPEPIGAPGAISPAKVRAQRQAVGLSLAKFGAALELPVQPCRVAAWEAGRQPIPARRAEDIARVLGCQPDAIINPVDQVVAS